MRKLDSMTLIAGCYLFEGIALLFALIILLTDNCFWVIPAIISIIVIIILVIVIIMR